MVYKAPEFLKGRSMSHVDTGRRPAFVAVTRTALFSLALVAAAALAGCTTVEGTNALTDPVTFEREVMTSTAIGLGLVPRAEKEDITSPRAPLVVPKTNATLPAPQQQVAVAALPVDSDKVQVDASGMSEADIKRLRNARVVDLRTLNGRPLTDAEAKQLTARMTAVQVNGGKRPLYLPPEEYYTNVAGQDLVCLAPNGQLVALKDPTCPAEIRKALGQ